MSTTTVHLLNLPPTLWLASRQHHDGLLRELVLHLAAHTDEGDADVDLEGTDRARTLLSTAVLGVLENARSEEADRAGLPPEHPSPLPVVPRSIDVELEVPPPDVSAFGSLQDTLDVAERLATQGRLLTAPGLPEVVAVRDWACEQVVAQLNGATAAPWPGTAQERFTEAVHAETGQVVPAAVLPWVTDADRGVVAVDRANRVAAVSAPLARLLGWEVADLVGRRVVALIPPALREAHVSGFSRYLSTGEAHILGVPLTLPVLHADGVTETLCEFMVEQAQSDDGRPVFLAWISPAPREAGSQAGEVALSGYRTATSGEAGDARG